MNWNEMVSEHCKGIFDSLAANALAKGSDGHWFVISWFLRFWQRVKSLHVCLGKKINAIQDAFLKDIAKSQIDEVKQVSRLCHGAMQDEIVNLLSEITKLNSTISDLREQNLVLRKPPTSILSDPEMEFICCQGHTKPNRFKVTYPKGGDIVPRRERYFIVAKGMEDRVVKCPFCEGDHITKPMPTFGL